MLTIGSLFSGIGGLELGLERAGLGPVLWQVEIDPFCREALAEHWPNARRFENVKTATAIPYVDVLCGGFPCQPVSLAGKGLAQADPRWLWPDFARIVREIRPRFVVVENVPGLLRRGLDIVIADLTAAGYAMEATRLSAADVGATHKRERLWIVAHGHGHGREGERRSELLDGERSSQRDDVDGCGGEAVADPEGVGRRKGRTKREPKGKTGTVGPSGKTVVHAASSHRSERYDDTGVGRVEGGFGQAQFGRPGLDLWPPSPGDVQAWRSVPAFAQPSVCRLADGVPPRLARRAAKLKALGNAVVPACAEIVGRRILEVMGR